MKNPITQEDFSGCGVACVAFVTQHSYRDIAKMLGRSKAKKIGFLCSELLKALRDLGYKYSLSYIKSSVRKQIYKDGTIVFIQRSKKYPDGHFLVRYSGKWMDPWTNWAINGNVNEAKSGFRLRLPGHPIYVLSPK